jgi:hypothetical protein
MMRAVALLALVCAAEGSWDSFRKLDLGMQKTDPLELKVKMASDAIGTPAAKARAFVINLQKRRDRCICMSHQLKNAPFQAERFNAVAFQDPRTEEQKFELKADGATQWKPVEGKDLAQSDLCGGLFKKGVVGGQHSVLQEMSLVCSHYSLWNKLKSQPEDAFIVMEDDLPADSKIWGKIDNFVKNYKGKWDLVQVDAYGKNGTDMPAEDKVDEFEGAPIYKPSDHGEYWGGHMFIIRKAALPKMLHRMKLQQSAPVDWLPKKWATTSINVRTVQFGMINYIDDEKRNAYYKQSNCGTQVDMSDINFSGKRARGNNMGGQRAQMAKNEGALECPAVEKKTTLKRK